MGSEMCIRDRPDSAPCAIVQDILEIWDCTNCTKNSDFTGAQIAAIKSDEDAKHGTQDVTRLSDPTIKQDCHGATLGIPYRVDSIRSFFLIRGYQETSNPSEAVFCIHGSSETHSSHSLTQGNMTVVGCDGQPQQQPTTMVTGKFGVGSRLRMPLPKVQKAYPGTVIYVK